jgi:hypothetical protein
MWPPPLFRRRPRAAQIIGAVVLPIGFGALCGAMLGASQVAFNLLMLLAGIGGVLAGFEHAGAREGVLRGLTGGVLFAGALAAVFEVRGVPALTPLPAAVPVMAVFYAVTGMPLGALGGWLRRRSEVRRARTALPSQTTSTS